MAKYLLRAIRQVVVYEVTGQDKMVECANDAAAHLEAIKFAAAEFPGKIDMEVEIKKMEDGGMGPVDPPPSNGGRKDTNYGSPF